MLLFNLVSGLNLEQIQDLKSFFPYLVRVTWYSQYTHITKNSHKINLTKSDRLKWYHDLFFKGNPDVDSEIWNFISSTRYGYICILATFWANLTSTNQGHLYIIWIRILRRFWHLGHDNLFPCDGIWILFDWIIKLLFYISLLCKTGTIIGLCH